MSTCSRSAHTCETHFCVPRQSRSVSHGARHLLLLVASSRRFARVRIADYLFAMRHPSLHTWLALAAVVVTVRDAAAGVSARLVYTRNQSAASCPDQPALASAVAARLGYNPFVAFADQTIVAEVTARGETARARAELVGKDGVALGSRELTGSLTQCEDLVASLALAISITLDPMSLSSQAEVAPRSSGDRTASKASPPEDVVGLQQPVPRRLADVAPSSPLGPPRAEASSSSASSVSADIDLGAVVGLGFLPNLAPGLRGGVRLRTRRISLGLEGDGLWPSSEPAVGASGVRASLLLARVYPCVDLGPIAGCALASFGRLHAAGEGVSDAREESSFYSALGVRIVGTVSVGTRWSLLLHGDIEKILTFPAFQLNGREVWRPSAFSADAGLALSYRFF